MEETTKKKGGAFLWLAIIFFISGILTFIPYKNIDDECMLGYKALCAITPISSLILIVIGAFFLFLRSRANKS
ncbi:MAG: hypothetical protein NTU73_11260 [Ignavibacteriae bacterium]|nr:hypothetical protein [Ignavibacteriota bacterium]